MFVKLNKKNVITQASLCFATLFWAGNFAVGRMIFNDISPVMLNFLRWSVALVFTFLFISNRLGHISVILRNYCGWFLIMGICGVVYHILVYTALSYTTVTNMALIIGATPAMILLLSTLLHGDRHTLPRIVIVGLSILGVAVIVQEDLTIPNIGDLIACVALVMWAYYNVTLRYCPVAIEGTVLTAAITFTGVLAIIPLVFVELAINGPPTMNAKVISAVLYVGIFASGIAFLFWNRGVVEIGPVKAGQFMNLVPVFGVILGTLLLKEPFTLRHTLAAVLIVSSLILSELYGQTETRPRL